MLSDEVVTNPREGLKGAEKLDLPRIHPTHKHFSPSHPQHAEAQGKDRIPRSVDNLRLSRF